MKQRELKFRALCLVDCKQGDSITKMVYFTKLECDNGLWFNPEDEDIYHINEYLSPFMQFTGLKGKNGVDIYEGDIIKFSYPHGGKEVLGVIRWSRGGYYVVKTNDEGYNNKVIPFPCALEIIGNIHEHKHLLK